MTNMTIRPDDADTLSSVYLPAPGLDDPTAVTGARSRWRFLTDPSSVVPTLIGVGICLVGFVFLIVGWSEVAGEVDVWRQMPFLLSAGLPGIGLVMVGLVVINVSARRQDGAHRARQMAALTESLRELQRSLDR